MERKPIQTDDKSHDIIRLEAIRQSFKKDTVITMGDVIAQHAAKLNKKYKFIKETKKCAKK